MSEWNQIGPNRIGRAEPTFASSMPASLQSSLPASLPAGRRSAPPYSPMGAADNGLFALQGELRKRLAALGGIFQLPTTLQGYLVFTFCLLILAFTMVLHVTLSAEIMRLNERLDGLRSQYEVTERTNAGLIYEISRYSALQDVNKKAVLAGYIPADKYKYVVERPDVVAALDNPAIVDMTPQYLILGGDPTAPGEPAVVLDAAPPASSADTGFWSNFRWQRVRDAWAETGSWLRTRLPAWGTR